MPGGRVGGSIGLVIRRQVRQGGGCHSGVGAVPPDDRVFIDSRDVSLWTFALHPLDSLLQIFRRSQP
jgi:hypothetical protein